MTWKEALGEKRTFLKAVCVVLVLVLMTGTVAAATAGSTTYVASVGDTRYTTVAAAVMEAEGQVVKLLGDSQETVTVSGDMYLDLNGYSLAALTVTDGTLYGMDSTTDDYDCADGYGRILSFTGSCARHHKSDISGSIKRYLSVDQNGTVSFHRFYLGITHRSLQPAKSGVGYKAVFAGDEMVQAQLHETQAFGYRLQLDAFNPVYRWKTAGEFVSEKQITLRLNHYDEVNYGETELHAAVQIKLADGTLIASQTYSDTLRGMIETVNAQTVNYTLEQLNALAGWIKGSNAMLCWEVEHILNPSPVIRISNVTAKAGQSVDVPVLITNNSGVAGAKITVTYDTALTLSAAVSGEAFSELQYTGPGRFVSPCSFTWDSESGMVTRNGTILVLTFEIPADAAAGQTYTLGCAYRSGDIYDEDLNDVDVNAINGSITVEAQQLQEAYTVTFLSYDGSVLKTETVSNAGEATAPAAPERPGYVFVGWDKAFTNVTSDLTVTAQYQKIDGPTVMVSKVTAQAGQSVDVPVQIINNPGVAGAKITMAYDTALTLSAAASGEAFSALQYTKPGKFVSPCNFTWDSESGMVTQDGTILILTFDVPANAAPGQVYTLNCSYRSGDIYDEDLNDVEFEIISGSIIVAGQEAVKSYTVTFRDYDGTVLKTEAVTDGGSATAPAVPERFGYVFTGWDKSFDAVTSDLVITAQYQKVSGPTIQVSHVTAEAGQSIEVPVRIINNPGVAGAKITMAYDTALTLSAAASGEAFSALQYTKPGKFVSPCNFTWDSESGMVTQDGTILILTFDVPANAAPGQVYTLNCSYRSGDIYDEDLNDVEFEIISGSITVGAQAAVKNYTVTFRDYDGAVLKTETVTDGGSATAPAVPERFGYVFTGWDKAFTNVTSDLTVTAQYQKIENATVMVSNVTAQAGQRVAVPVLIINNPGVAGAKFTMAYDTALTLSAAASGEAFSALQYTKPGKFVSPCNFTWDSESGMATQDGTILILTFDVPANAASGQVYTLSCSYRSGDIYDEDLNDVEFDIISGSITVA